MPQFKLDKWFLDIVADTGECVIVYYAHLAWGHLHLTWSSILEASPTLAPRPRFSLANIAAPAPESDVLTWSHSSLQFHARYRLIQHADPVTLLDTPAGAIQWHCISPLADAQFTIGPRQLAGRGYIERLQMTLPPWSLPLDTLHWGHFYSNDHSLVWIRWEGKHPLQIALLDGRPATMAPDQLHLHQVATLRDGPIAGTILPSIPLLKNLLPPRITGMTESKWLSTGQLLNQPGWAIHEIVRFGKPPHD